jgi:peptide/nickel transport system permease protein
VIGAKAGEPTEVGAEQMPLPATAGGSRRRLRPLDAVALAIVVVAVLAAIFAPLLASHSPTGGNILEQFEEPGAGHLLGTDENGNDIAARLLYGARPSLLGPVAVVLLSLLVGIPLALVSVWRGGLTDAIIGRALDLVFSFPAVLIASILVLLYGGGLLPAIVAVAISYIPWAARLTRTATLRERHKPYVLACEIQGMSAPWIAVRHVLPNLARLIAAQATVALGYALIDLAALSFLGLGIRPPAPDWGEMVGDTAGFSEGNYTTPLAAAICIVLVVASVAHLGTRFFESEEEG